MDTLPFAALAVLVFLVAGLYSSVGHGGASGYLAALSFFAFSSTEASTTALMLNLLVAGTGTVNYWRAGHLSLSLTWPFLVTSVPAALVGGLLDVPTSTYEVLLALVLLFAAIRLLLPPPSARPTPSAVKKPLAVSLLFGAGIGFISGLVGVGGGIFLSPLLLLIGWATIKQTGATSALFIVANSASGLLGRAFAGHLAFGLLGPLVPIAFPAGLLGSYLGARKVPSPWLRGLLGVVLLVASTRLVLS